MNFIAKSMSNTKRAAAAIVLAAVCGSVHAGPIGIGAFGGGAQTTTFDGLGFPFSNAAPLVVDGHTITTDDGIVRYTDFGSSCIANECIGNNTDLGFVDIVLSTLSERAGAWTGAALPGWNTRADFFDAADVLLGSVNLVNGGDVALFAGWEDAGGIARIRFNDLTTNSRIVVVDNLVIERVQVPEPASLALVALGLAGLGFSRRKRAT